MATSCGFESHLGHQVIRRQIPKRPRGRTRRPLQKCDACIWPAILRPRRRGPVQPGPAKIAAHGYRARGSGMFRPHLRTIRTGGPVRAPGTGTNSCTPGRIVSGCGAKSVRNTAALWHLRENRGGPAPDFRKGNNTASAKGEAGANTRRFTRFRVRGGAKLRRTGNNGPAEHPCAGTGRDGGKRLARVYLGFCDNLNFLGTVAAAIHEGAHLGGTVCWSRGRPPVGFGAMRRDVRSLVHCPAAAWRLPCFRRHFPRGLLVFRPTVRGRKGVLPRGECDDQCE